MWNAIFVILHLQHAGTELMLWQLLSGAVLLGQHLRVAKHLQKTVGIKQSIAWVRTGKITPFTGCICVSYSLRV